MDTVEVARAMAYQQEFTKAGQLLSAYTSRHEEAEAWRLFAQVLYWSQDLNGARKAYQHFHRQFPEHQEGLFEYGKFLFETGNLTPSEKVLKKYLSFHPDHLEANTLLVYLETWNGNTGKAKKRANKTLQEHPENEALTNSLASLTSMRRPFISLATRRDNDDQPLKRVTYTVGGKWYNNWVLAPWFSYEGGGNTTLNNLTNTRWVQLGNTFQIKHFASLSLYGGLFSSSATTTGPMTTGSVEVKYKINRSWHTKVIWSTLPYQYSVASVLQPFPEIRKGLFLGHSGKSGTLGEAAYQVNQYPDKNLINNAYVWFLGPVIKNEDFSLKLGGAYSFSTSTFTTYKVDSTPAPRQGGPPFLRKEPLFQGYYDPYFTPLHQNIVTFLSHVVIGNDPVSLTLKFNPGLIARAYAPEWSGNPGSITYNKTSYHPMELEATLLVKPKGPLSVSTGYHFQRLFFYQIHSLDFGLFIDFSKTNK